MCKQTVCLLTLTVYLDSGVARAPRAMILDVTHAEVIAVM